MNNAIIYFLNTQGVLLLVFGVLLFLYLKEGMSGVFKHTLSVAVITLFVTIVLKEIFNMPRPFSVNDNVNPLAGLTYFQSFPSSHAALAFAVSTTVSLHKRRLGIFLLILSALISVGRVAAHVHYPTDVAFGILLGVTVTLFFDTFHIRKKAAKKHT